MLIYILTYAGFLCGALLLAFICIIIINILQNGGRWNGKSLEEILGKDPATVNFSDIENYSKAQLMQLFYAAPAPIKDELNGEIDGMAPAVGIFYPFANFFLTFIYGQGAPWVGKAFNKNSSPENPDYNLFKDKKNGTLFRRRLMDVFIEKSRIDDKKSLHLAYAAYNKDLAGLIRDEVRQINSNLYIGMGYLTIPLGSWNPIPFILHGQFRPWVGPDRK